MPHAIAIAATSIHEKKFERRNNKKKKKNSIKARNAL
jgi:hypothetical protein